MSRKQFAIQSIAWRKLYAGAASGKFSKAIMLQFTCNALTDVLKREC